MKPGMPGHGPGAAGMPPCHERAYDAYASEHQRETRMARTLRRPGRSSSSSMQPQHAACSMQHERRTGPGAIEDVRLGSLGGLGGTVSVWSIVARRALLLPGWLAGMAGRLGGTVNGRRAQAPTLLGDWVTGVSVAKRSIFPAGPVPPAPLLPCCPDPPSVPRSASSVKSTQLPSQAGQPASAAQVQWPAEHSPPGTSPPHPSLPPPLLPSVPEPSQQPSPVPLPPCLLPPLPLPCSPSAPAASIHTHTSTTPSLPPFHPPSLARSSPSFSIIHPLSFLTRHCFVCIHHAHPQPRHHRLHAPNGPSPPHRARRCRCRRRPSFPRPCRPAHSRLAPDLTVVFLLQVRSTSFPPSTRPPPSSLSL